MELSVVEDDASVLGLRGEVVVVVTSALGLVVVVVIVGVFGVGVVVVVVVGVETVEVVVVVVELFEVVLFLSEVTALGSLEVSFSKLEGTFFGTAFLLGLSFFCVSPAEGGFFTWNYHLVRP